MGNAAKEAVGNALQGKIASLASGSTPNGKTAKNPKPKSQEEQDMKELQKDIKAQLDSSFVNAFMARLRDKSTKSREVAMQLSHHKIPHQEAGLLGFDASHVFFARLL